MEKYQIDKLKESFEGFEGIVKNEFLHLNSELLNFKPNNGSWSILECIAHLNLYSEYYLIELQKIISKAEASPKAQRIKWSWFGKISVEKIAISNNKKMKTFARMDPDNSQLSIKVLEDFIIYNNQLKEMSQKCEHLNFNTRGVKVEFFKILKLSLAETLIFMMEHQNRHLIQAQNVLKRQSKAIV
tara:strand:- start:419 stop:976 length:558 start_codon:yes stop_codon:yes gene_type:complete